jgi:hypothetical protein
VTVAACTQQPHAYCRYLLRPRPEQWNSANARQFAGTIYEVMVDLDPGNAAAEARREAWQATGSTDSGITIIRDDLTPCRRLANICGGKRNDQDHRETAFLEYVVGAVGFCHRAI